MKRLFTAFVLLFFAAPLGVSAETTTILLSNQTNTPTPEVSTGYTITPTSHADVNVSYDTAERTFSIGFRNANDGHQFNGANAIVYGGANLIRSIPSTPQWSFLGEPGDPVWILPAGLTGANSVKSLYLGFTGYGVPTGTFTGSAVGRFQLRVHSIENLTSPNLGEFYGYETSGGNPVFKLSSSALYGNSYELPANGHSHLNLAFTSSGMFRVWLIAQGTLQSTGETVTSQPQPLYFGMEEWQIPPATYNDWRQVEFSPEQATDPSLSGPEADPDFDSLTNLEEYAFGGNPLVADAALIRPRLSLRDNLWILTVRQRVDTLDLAITPQATATLGVNLADWRADLMTPLGSRPVTSSIDEFDYRLDDGATREAFLRVQTQLTSP